MVKDKTEQLITLKVELEKLVAILRQDEACTWFPHFDRYLARTTYLLEAGFEQNQLNELSSSIRSVYGGMGSFNDYVPPKGLWGEQKFADHVWDAAMALKITGEY